MQKLYKTNPLLLYFIVLCRRGFSIMNKRWQSNILLLLAAFIWGSAFVAQKSGMSYIGPLTFSAVRSLLAAVFLGLLVFAQDRLKAEKGSENSRSGFFPKAKDEKKHMLLGGLCCGCILFTASILQQFGLVTVSAGKTGFITALYLVLVPIFGLAIGKKPRPIHIVCVPLALAGLWLLTMKGAGLQIGAGEILNFFSAIGFAWHILCVDHFAQDIDGIKLSFMQFTVCTVLSFAGMFIFEEPDPSAIMSCFGSIAYAGILSSGIAFTFQILAQKNIEPTVACLLMSLESVFSVLSGWLILNEHMSPRELTGCAIMFFAVILSQLAPESKKEVSKS